MKHNLLWVLLFSLFTTLQAQSQSLNIQTTDATAFPVIRATVQVHISGPVHSSDFKVLEDRKEVPFTLKQAVDSTAEKGKAVFILIEASGFTHGKAAENFKKAVVESLNGLGAADQVNVGYFGKANRNGRTLNILSAEFTTDKSSLKNEINSRISTTKDTTYVADVYKAIYEALDFMVAKQGLPENKRLIVLSAAINNSKSPIKAEDCIEKSQRLKIPIYTITYKTGNRYAPDNFVRLSDRTNGKTTLAKTLDELRSAAKQLVSNATGNNAKTPGEYILEFTTANRKNGRMYQYEVRYKDEKQAATYTAPEEEGGFMGNSGLYILLSVGLIGGGMAWFMYQAKQKKLAFEANKGVEQEVLLKEAEAKERQGQMEVQDLAKSAQQPPMPKKDLKRTVIAGGGASPVLMISAGNFSQNFSLDRLHMSIGRGEGNDIVIPEATVSGKHAAIINENGVFFINDVGSTNGTFVNNSRIQGKQLLKSGDLIQMGAAQLKFQV